MSELSNVLKVKNREPGGKSQARKLRAENLCPAVVYGDGSEAVHFSLDSKAFVNARREFGRTHLYQLKMENGETVPALIKDIQVDSFRNRLLHVDFWKVSLATNVTLPVGLEFTGRCRGVVKGGKFQPLRRTIPVVGRPGAHPDSVTMDITDLDIGESIQVSQMPLPEGAKPAGEEDYAIATVIAPKRGQMAKEEEKK